MSENNNSIGLNELVDYQKKTYSPGMDKVMKFLWRCAGADAQILQFSPYSDHIKNAGIGGVVLATSVMASLAMGFAMHTIFASPVEGKVDPITGGELLAGNWFVTIPVSIVWGLIIFNLDRFIVSTVKGDGTEAITPKEWGSMLPRLFMAILIGLTISAPLETYIFKREIHREWKLSMEKLALSEEYRIEQKNNNLNKRNITAFEEKDKQISKQQEKYDKANQEYQDELSGKNTGNGWGDGPVAKKKEKIKDLELAELNRLRGELKELENEKDKFKGEVEGKKEKSTEEVLALKPGFLDQLMMLEKLSTHGKEVEKYNAATNEIETFTNNKGEQVVKKEEIYGAAFWPIWLVRLLFMIIEIAPVIFKFMIWKSSYDYLQENVSQILEAKQGISLDNFLDENNKSTLIRENYNARRIAEVSKRQNDLEKENAIHAITLFAEKEREAIQKNPELFVKEENTDSLKNSNNDTASSTAV
jgi:hypothetical protein